MVSLTALSNILPTDWMLPQWPAPQWVGAVMTSRSGGVSAQPYHSMNLGDHVNDDPQSVAQNRQILQQLTGTRPIYVQQVHGVNVVQLDENAAEQTMTQTPMQADAGFTQVPNIACTIMVADCLPVLVCHAQERIVGAAHAGWRSLAGQQGKGVLETLLQNMQQQKPHANPDGWMAWLGPCIGANVFEVGGEVRTAFMQNHVQAADCFMPAHAAGNTAEANNKWLANLAGLARQRLAALGVHAVFGNDGSAEWCTYSRPQKYFSYRRDRQTGRMAAAVWLKE